MPEPGWVPIFYGEPSRDMWDDINSAKSKEDLRLALYVVCCRLQELESRLERHFGEDVQWRNRSQSGKHPGHRNDGYQGGQYWDLEWSHPAADPRYFGEGP